jgi:hypothetical protein
MPSDLLKRYTLASAADARRQSEVHLTSNGDSLNPEEFEIKKSSNRTWLIIWIIAVLAVDYATILRIEIFSEVKNGKSVVEAVMHGNVFLTAVGILISVVGVAWVVYLAAGKNNGKNSL